MVLESTIVCVDNSNFTRNGDYYPTRLSAEIDAVNMICMVKTRSNPENNVGLVTLSNGRVVVNLTQEAHKISANLSKLLPDGQINFETGIRVAHLALKHRQGRNHKMRIIAFIGSPILEDEKELVKIAKRLKKEKVNVDVVCIGQEGDNLPKLEQFILALNGKDRAGSHLLIIPPGALITEALSTSIIFQGEEDTGNDPFSMDGQEDPELAMALRLSMEEQRSRETDQPAGAGNNLTTPGGATGAQGLSGQIPRETAGNVHHEQGRLESNDVYAMTEDEQLARAIRLSISEPPTGPGAAEEPMDTDDYPKNIGKRCFLASTGQCFVINYNAAKKVNLFLFFSMCTNESLGNKKIGMRMRRGSDADKKYQSGARASINDVKDHRLEIMDKMGGLTLSMGALSHNKSARYVIGLISDENTTAGFALAGCLETGHLMQPKTENQSDPHHKTKAKLKGFLGRKTFFVVERDTSQEDLERAFRALSRRDDLAVLAINGDIIDRLAEQITKHDAKGTLPIIVPLPFDDDPFRCIEDKALQRPKNFGFLNLNDPLQLFYQGRGRICIVDPVLRTQTLLTAPPRCRLCWNKKILPDCRQAQWTRTGSLYAAEGIQAIGWDFHNVTLKRWPAYSMRILLKDPENFCSPGPASHVYPAKLTHTGMVHPPAYSLGLLLPPLNKDITPGSDTYDVGNHELQSLYRAPAWVMALAAPEDKFQNFPAPNQYEIPKLLGARSPYIQNPPCYTMRMKLVVGSFTQDFTHTPGANRYATVSLEVIKVRAPAYKLKSRRPDLVGLNVPGPATYSPTSANRMRAPGYSLGIKHTIYLAPFKAPEPDVLLDWD